MPAAVDDRVVAAADDIGVVAVAAVERVDPGAAVEHIVALAAQQRVVAAEAIQHVVAAESGQEVRAAVAGDRVVAGAAGPADGAGRADQDQLLDIDRQRERDRCIDRIDAGALGLDNGVASIVHEIGVVAGPAHQGVGAAAAIEHVATGATDDEIRAAVADHMRLRRDHHRRLDAVGHRVGDVGGNADDIVAAIGQFDDDVARVVDHKGVVADAAHQGVCARVPVDPVVAGTAHETIVGLVAVDRVVQCIASAIDRRRPGHEHQPLDVGRQGVVRDRGKHAIVAAADAGKFDDLIAGVVDGVLVVAEAADHGVGAGAAVDGVVAGAAVDTVVAGAADQRVCRGVAGEDEVGPAADDDYLDAGGGGVAQQG